ncbi:MAG: rod shape-determining protein MreC [Planctomycetota bacterium]
MAGKQIRVSRRILLTWFMLAGFIFLFIPQKLTNKFQFAFARTFSWPLSIGRNISLSARMPQPLTNVVSRRKYNRLQNYLANVTEELLQERQRLERLSGLHNRFVWEGVDFVLADIVAAFIDASHCEFIINRGKIDCLAKGQFVLGDNSIVGTISDVASHTARVRLITDPTSKIAVKIEELNSSRIMQGSGNSSAKVQMVKHKVKAGNNVYVDKKPGFLDAPMIAGKVRECERNDEIPLLWDITVKPACDIETLNNVAVIIMNPRE